jgi:hypothetical protein
MKKNDIKTLVWTGSWAVAFGFVEAVVVYYQRKLYFPDDILFPLKAVIPFNVVLVECSREFATIVMLLSVAFLAGAKTNQRFAYFIYSFAIWDIFYYVGLKVLLNWPASFFTWDVLFLIPVVWASPVLAPVIVSLNMVLLAVIMIHFSPFRLNNREWFLLILSSALIYITFVWDYSGLLWKYGLTGPELGNAVSKYKPLFYHWDIFSLAQFIVLLTFTLFYRRAVKTSPKVSLSPF